MKEGIAISIPPTPPMHFKSIYFMLLGKEVLKKMIKVLEKSSIFSQQILYEPWVYKPFYFQQFTTSYFILLFYYTLNNVPYSQR